MFYPQQYLISAEQQYQQEEQQRKELEQLLKQQLLRQTLLLSTPPPSPMSATLGHPNRSCASCKKRKVKCDRKTPSCTACQKSKHRCHYTSYSPPVFTEESQQQPDDNEQIKAIKQKIEELDNSSRQRLEYFQRMVTAYQPTMAKDEFGNPSAPYYVDDEEIYNFGVVPASAGSQFLQGSPQQLLPSQHQLQVPSQQQPVSYILPQQQYQQRVNSTGTSPFVQTQNVVVPSGNGLSGTIVLNYNLNGMKSFLGRNAVPVLQSMTGGQGPPIPPTGFTDVIQLQSWLREKFLNQDWNEEMESYGGMDPEERFDIRPIFDEVNQQNSLFVQQKFEVTLHRAEFSSSPSPPSVHGGDFQTYDYEEKHNMDMENYSETGSNRSSVTDLDPMDAFLNKIYAFVRRFIRNLPWLRENFLANWRRSPDAYNDGVFSDVVVEVRKIPSYNPYHQDLKIVQNNEVKGRLTFF